MIRVLAAATLAAGFTITASNAHALFLFGPKKWSLECSLGNEHPGAGSIPKRLPAVLLSPQGSASLSGRIDMISRNQVLAKNVLVKIDVAKAAQADRYNIAASFTKATGQLIHKGTSMLQPGAWGAVTYQDSRSQAYLEARCLVTRAK